MADAAKRVVIFQLGGLLRGRCITDAKIGAQDFGSWKRRCLISKILLGRLMGADMHDPLSNGWIGTSFFVVTS